MSKVIYIAPAADAVEMQYSTSPLCSSFDDTYGTEIINEEGEISI